MRPRTRSACAAHSGSKPPRGRGNGAIVYSGDGRSYRFRAVKDASADALSLARDLAVLDVNTNTVLRALRQLRDEGMLDFRRGRGITVAATPDYGALVEAARNLVLLARRHGYRRDELLTIIESLDV